MEIKPDIRESIKSKIRIAQHITICKPQIEYCKRKSYFRMVRTYLNNRGKPTIKKINLDITQLGKKMGHTYSVNYEIEMFKS